MDNTQTLAKGRQLSSSVEFSWCHLLPNVTDIGEKFDRITSVPFQASKGQSVRVVETWCQISIRSQVCLPDICNSPSTHWLVHVSSLYVFEIDTAVNIDTVSASLQNRLMKAFQFSKYLLSSSTLAPPCWFWSRCCDLLWTMTCLMEAEALRGIVCFHQFSQFPSHISTLQIPSACVLKPEDAETEPQMMREPMCNMSEK